MSARLRPSAPGLARLFQPSPPDRVAQAGLRCLRRIAWLLVFSLAWSFALSPVALAAKAQGPAAASVPHPVPTSVIWQTARQARQAQARQERVQRAMAAHAGLIASPVNKGRSRTALSAPRRGPAPPPTLLDEVGQLARPVSSAQVTAWKRELKTSHPTAPREAALHLWLGEFALAHDEQPRLARWHFRRAQRLSHPGDALAGLAAYDAATALYCQGAYDEAAAAFHRLLMPRTALPGYDRRTCALWLRHAGACAGYHEQHARLGIPEPPQLDPQCGVAAVAAGLRALSLPYDQDPPRRLPRYRRGQHDE